MAQKRYRKRKKAPSPGPYSFEIRLRVVRMHLEEQYPITLISEETGVGKSTISAWARKYKLYGEDGLKSRYSSSSRQKKRVNKAVENKIIDLKKTHPYYGPRRISDILKRFFFIKTSPSTVHKTLSDKDLVEKRPSKRKKNQPKPRFFERSTPNQLWQSDICTFRLAGKNAYLIGFIDDYSRYIIGLGLYRSQTATNVLEIYRRAAGEYNVPREMLTDNGRQYVNWRGTTKFQYELKKDRVKHIRSRPLHPMTLGKIERFWKTIQQEFLFRCQFASFEDAQQRIAVWINYYNHRRPHQGIKGLCPADRYFEIQSELKQTLARGIEENALELALRGKPQDPFYMVGRMNGQNVVIRAEKGKVRMMVDEEDGYQGKELVYNLNMEETDNDHKKESQGTPEVHGGREAQSSPSGMDRVSERICDLQGDETELDPSGSLAEPGNGGYACSIGTKKERTVTTAEQQAYETAYEETICPEQWVCEAGGPSADGTAQEAEYIELTRVDLDEQKAEKAPAGNGTEPCGNHHEGPCRLPYGNRGGCPAGGIPEDLLQVGEPGPCRSACRTGREENGPTRTPGPYPQGD